MARVEFIDHGRAYLMDRAGGMVVEMANEEFRMRRNVRRSSAVILAAAHMPLPPLGSGYYEPPIPVGHPPIQV